MCPLTQESQQPFQQRRFFEDILCSKISFYFYYSNQFTNSGIFTYWSESSIFYNNWVYFLKKNNALLFLVTRITWIYLLLLIFTILQNNLSKLNRRICLQPIFLCLQSYPINHKKKTTMKSFLRFTQTSCTPWNKVNPSRRFL